MRQKSRKEIGVRLFIALIVLGDVFLQLWFRRQQIGLENEGVSFGWGKGWGSVVSFLTYLLFIGWYAYEKWRKGRDYLSIYLMAMGGVGNLLNRLIWGSVWDYVCISFLPFCFNLSDVLITVGAISYILGVDEYRGFVRRQRDAGN